MGDLLTIWIESGPNQAAREWAGRFVAARCGLPFRLARLAPGEKPPAAPGLYYGRTAGAAAVTITPSGYFDGGIESSEAPPAEAPADFAGVPVPFGGRGVERSETAAVINADVFASAFFLANRVEEVSATHFDEHGRFPAASSFAGRNGVVGKPLIDMWAAELVREIERLYPGLERKRRWGEGDFAVCVTHDIETLARIRRPGYLAWHFLAAARSLARRRFTAAGRGLYAGVSRFLTGRSPSWSFQRLRAGERPSPGTYFFFGGATSPKDGSYDVESDDVKAAVRGLVREGCEVGVHLGSGTGRDAGSMLRQKSKVAGAAGAGVCGARHHYLCARFPEIWTAHEEAGFEYDASLGYAQRCGFRAGTSLPYRPFALKEGRMLDLFEVPLVAMDGSFFQYRNLNADETVDEVVSLAREVAAVGGVFTLLWHNTMVDPLDRPAESRAYFEVTRALREMGGWWTTLGGCIGRWKEHLASLEA